MPQIAFFLTVLVMVIQFCFVALETLLWIFPEARKIFPKGKKITKVAKKFSASEDILTGAIAFGLLWGLRGDSTLLILCGLTAAIATGIYDGLKVHKSIFFIKSVPAFLAIVAIIARSMA